MHQKVRGVTPTLPADVGTEYTSDRELSFVTVWSADFDHDSLDDDYVPLLSSEKGVMTVKKIKPAKLSRTN